MNCNQCHAAKDFVRTVQLSIDDLVYAASMVKERENIFRRFSLEAMPVLRLGAELSRQLMRYSSYEPLLRFARNAEKELEAQIRGLQHAEKYCSDSSASRDETENYMISSGRICGRMVEDMRMTDISERLGCDYLRYMICLIEGAVRLSENALSYELCSAAVVPIRSISRNGREMLHNMRKLLAIID
ncbi:MAG: hypothetical protein IJZ89_02645 [Clostridia bacterium]|nr:hypothetical protein [Clostridia bacterium]